MNVRVVSTDAPSIVSCALTVTELLRQEDNGADPELRGRINKLPVICVPGFCSSGLMVKKSAVNPSWINSRVWFSLQKLGRARTQAVGSATDGAAQTLTLKIHKVSDLILSIEHNHDDIDGMAVNIRLLSKKGQILAETQTDAFRLLDVDAWAGTADYEQEIVLATDAVESAKSLRLSLVDEDSAEFAEDDDDGDEEATLGATTIKLKALPPGEKMTLGLEQNGMAGPVGSIVLTSGALVVN